MTLYDQSLPNATRTITPLGSEQYPTLSSWDTTYARWQEVNKAYGITGLQMRMAQELLPGSLCQLAHNTVCEQQYDVKPPIGMTLSGLAFSYQLSMLCQCALLAMSILQPYTQEVGTGAVTSTAFFKFTPSEVRKYTLELYKPKVPADVYALVNDTLESLQGAYPPITGADPFVSRYIAFDEFYLTLSNFIGLSTTIAINAVTQSRAKFKGSVYTNVLSNKITLTPIKKVLDVFEDAHASHLCLIDELPFKNSLIGDAFIKYQTKIYGEGSLKPLYISIPVKVNIRFEANNGPNEWKPENFSQQILTYYPAPKVAYHIGEFDIMVMLDDAYADKVYSINFKPFGDSVVANVEKTDFLIIYDSSEMTEFVNKYCPFTKSRKYLEFNWDFSVTALDDYNLRFNASE